MTKPAPKRPPHAFQWKPVASRVGETLKTVLSSHPVVVGFTIMTASVVAQCLLKDKENKGSKLAKDVNWQLGGLYAGVQGTIAALAAVPIITSVVGATGQALGGGLLSPKPSTPAYVPPTERV